MLATTLASFAGTADHVRNRSTQAARTWQTQKQLARQLTAGEGRTALEAAAARQAPPASRADHLRDRHEDELNRRDALKGGLDSANGDQVAESLDQNSREPRRAPTSSASAQAGPGEPHLTSEQNVTEIREQRAVQAHDRSAESPSASGASGGVGKGVAPALAEPDAASPPQPFANSNDPTGLHAKADAPMIQNPGPSAGGQQAVKSSIDTAPRVESDQAAAKAAPAAAKSAGSAVNLQNVTAAPGGKRADAESAKAGANLNRAATSPTPRGIDITQAKAMQELAGIVRSRISARESTIQLRLDPPELGKVQIDLNMKRDVLTLRIETQTQAGHDALHARLSELRHALEQHGITINRVEVELSPPVTPGHDAGQAQQHPPQDPATQEQAYQQTPADGSSHGDGGEGASDDPGSNWHTASENDTGLAAGTTNDREYGDLPSLAETGLDLVV
jgi:flagellar hook-length control protein FliK